jgi:hypothetical protein
VDIRPAGKKAESDKIHGLMSQPSLFSSRISRVLALLILFSTAFAIRLYDLTDLPLDFHPTRQLLSAIKARALYFQTQPNGYSTEELERGIYLAKLKATVEPVVFERLVAFTYRFTGEKVWIARIYSSLFWLIGGVFLFLLAQDLVSFEGALVSTTYYLIFPYAIIASRSFQPDILMVMLIISFWWAFARWMRLAVDTSPAGRGARARAAVLAGLLGGLALFIKFTAAFFVIGAALGLALLRFRFRDLFRNGQVWLIASLGALPAMLYLIYGLFIKGTMGGQFAGRFIPALLLNPFNYLQWITKADVAAGGIFIMLALLGFLFINNQSLRGLLTGLWISYVLYGLFFDYHIATHDYYQLPFIPIVALSLAPLGNELFARLSASALRRYQRNAVYTLLLFGAFTVVWNVRNQMKATDYRPQAAMYAEVGELLNDGTVIALTQDYGSRLEYWGGKTSLTWPYVGDLTYSQARGVGFSFERLFERYSSKRDFFLVTDFDELRRQPDLEEWLSHYPVIARANGYIIYQLKPQQ